MKTAYLNLLFILILEIILVGCNNVSSESMIVSKKGIVEKDSITPIELRTLINSYDIFSIDSTSFQNFIIGEKKTITENKISAALASKKLYKLNKYYFFLPTENNYKNGKLNMTCAVDFRFNDSVLTSIAISFFAPSDYFKPHLIQILRPKTLSEIEDYVKSNQFKNDYSRIQMNAIVVHEYLTSLSDILGNFYTVKYGKPKIKCDIDFDANLIYLNQNDSKKKNDLIWIKNGKYIELQFKNSAKNAEIIASREIDFDEYILIGNVFYSTIRFMKNNPTLEPEKTSINLDSLKKSKDQKILKAKIDSIGI